MRKRARENISWYDLIQVLKEFSRLSYKKTDSGGSYDFDRAIPFLRREGLDKNIIEQRRDTGIGKGSPLPLNSEKSIYSWMLNNVVVRNLSVDIESRSKSEQLTEWKPDFAAMLHFENCRFNSDSSMLAFVFPWSGAIRFYRNEFKDTDESGIVYWLFNFGHGSQVTFVKNRFHSVNVQIRSHPVEEQIKIELIGLNHLSLLGNKGIGDLQLYCHSEYYELSGVNRIDRLELGKPHSNNDNDKEREFSFYFGPQEKIDPGFHHNRHHRKLFLSLRERANKNQDSQTVRTLDKWLDRIEYSLIRDQGIRLRDGMFVWLGYWQDRALHAWRRYTSDFYRSWARPLVMIVFGYLALNAVPWFVVDGFTVSDYVSFSLRPINKIPFYTDGLSDIYESQYPCLSYYSKNVLSLAGITQTLWLAVWGIALRKAIAR